MVLTIIKPKTHHHPFLPILILFTIIITTSSSLPLSTNSRWIVDETGSRVKLACVSWPSHLEPVLAEGLSKQRLEDIASKILSMGFNCVRLTWPLDLATNESVADQTVLQSFQRLGLNEAITGLKAKNPSILNLSLINAFMKVVTGLSEQNVMVILDNHLTKPGWCCSKTDGNGFFNDVYFNPDVWIQGLTKISTLFRNQTNVIGMSLRNELRGPKQNTKDWYNYMRKGAEAIHAANPNALVIVSGLSFDNDLSFLHNQLLKVSFTNKLVYEAHWYGFSDGQAWKNGNPNEVCGKVKASVMRRYGYLIGKGWPLFLSEFGMDLRGGNVNDNRYFGCFLSVAAELDFDWAVWSLTGSYYYRQGVVGMEEFYGMLDYDFNNPRNTTFLNRIELIQSALTGPGVSDVNPRKVIFHPETGLCVVRGKSVWDPLELGSCKDTEAWEYNTRRRMLMIKGTYFCLQATGVGKPVKLDVLCSVNSSGISWEPISDSKMHLSTTVGSSNSSRVVVCLDVDYGSGGGGKKSIVAAECKCLSGKDSGCDPEGQWFKMIDTTRSSLREQIS